MKKYIVWFILMFKIAIFFVLAYAPAASALRINEVMYNPAGDDNNKEFIEIYFELGDERNLSNYIISDSSSNDTLKQPYYFDSDYALITEDGFNYSGINASVYSAGATIGNNLDNTQDGVYIYDKNKTLIDFMVYDGNLANGNGKSMEYKENENGWLESTEIGGTPGWENSVEFGGDSYNQTNNTNNNASNNTNNTNGANNTVDCVPSIIVYTDKQVYNNSETVNIYLSIYNESLPFTIEYWIEDANGNIAKERYNTTNTNRKSWTPNINEDDKVFYVKADLYLDCDGQTEYASSDDMFVVIGDKKNSNTSISIEEVYLGEDNKTQFGQPLRVKIHIYKGDESSSTVNLWAEDENGEKISQVSDCLFYNKNTEYDATIPVQLKPNCNEEFSDGQYRLVVEGFDIREEETFTIEGITSSMCPSSSKTASAKSEENEGAASKSTGEKTSISYTLLNFDNSFSASRERVTELLIQNDGSPHTFQIWSYVYRGSKCYSGEREGNKQELDLSPGEAAIVELKNFVVNETESGDYKFKVKINKDSQKTNKELTEDIVVLGSIKNQTKNLTINQQLKESLENKSNPANRTERVTGSVVYESQTAKSKGIALVFFLAAIFIGILMRVKGRLSKNMH